MNYELRIKKSRNAGYTIIETMIAVSLFLVVVTIGMGALLNANSLHNKAQNMRSILDNLNFVMEDMSRNLRTGYNYRCIVDNTDFNSTDTVATAKSNSGCWGIAFESAKGIPYEYDSNGVLINRHGEDQWVYYISSTGKIFRATASPYNVPASYVQLTPDEITINTTDSSFTVIGAEPPTESPGPDRQPFVTIKLVGSISYKGVAFPFSLQTSVSQRQLDI